MSKETTTQKGELSRRDLMKFSARYMLCSQACYNYETMQSLGALFAVGPFLERYYADDPELLKQKFREHMQIFNTQTTMGGCILGSTLAIEETRMPDATPTAIALRTSLMGPFAGIGDALFGTIPRTVFAAMSAYAAVEGNFVTGILTCLLGGGLLFFIRWMLIKIGYYEGASMIAERKEQINNIRESVSVLGIIIVGALCASNVSLTTPLTLSIGESVLEVQSTLDTILPYLLSVLSVGAVYWGLGRKKMTTIKMVWIIVAVSLALAVAGIIA